MNALPERGSFGLDADDDTDYGTDDGDDTGFVDRKPGKDEKATFCDATIPDVFEYKIIWQRAASGGYFHAAGTFDDMYVVMSMLHAKLYYHRTRIVAVFLLPRSEITINDVHVFF